ncbi:DegT/DnrJ/EryC1/StrS family aminotransferase [Catenovulum sp. 2E275]|uniref:DegT/DnrJ/EryC1/StrS family aminotransferase n=1 Tax=Catenovulum sp. 2E275 TaxID=2980497 RepID=UPI0021CF80C9|nr:DegT/DnrJ/EryC1/StrS family aminotransferase [Catenovulum sp. 2E275]MCU4674724.1 DegT/DnrJ/EryC1/StrS family aminotransferase [Catenovulum sp. 2E275]
MQFIDLKAQYEQSKVNINKRIADVLSHGQYIMGPEVHELEVKLAEYIGVKHAITCANGTDALQIALMTMGIGKGDAVIVPTFTFFASAEVIALSGATPIFIDSDLESFNLNASKLEATILHVLNCTDLNLKAIMAVDLFGQPADYEKINRLAIQYNLKVIEDAAQGFGGGISGKQAGCFGDIATTSFFPAKPLGCYGDGGAIFTDNDDYAELIRSIRLHGKGKDKYDNVRVGLNSRLDTLQAAILLEKLAIFPSELVRRNEVANLYSEYLSSQSDFILPTCRENTYSSWAQYSVQAVDKHRDIYIQRAQNKGIPTAVYYATCMHQQTVFKDINTAGLDLSNAEQIARSCFSLPMHPYLSDDEIEQVVTSLQNE